MALSYIIDEVCEKCGYDATDDRELLVRLINRACKEVYEFTDLPGSLKEIVVLATNNAIVALPSYVGELRAIRSHYTLERLTIRDMQSKYSFQPWKELWNKWRVIKKSPLKNCIENSALPIVVTLGEVDTVSINVTLTGSTETASKKSETITIAAGETEVQVSIPFTDLSSITKDVVNNVDVVITGADADGNEVELSVIPNDKLTIQYTLVDISLLPWGGDLGTGFRYVDVLYKEQLPWLSDDGDEFICPGFDDAIACKVCEFSYSAKEGGSQKALEYFEKCKDLLQKRVSHANGETEKEMTFAPNGLLGLHPPGWAFQRGPYRTY